MDVKPKLRQERYLFELPGTGFSVSQIASDAGLKNLKPQIFTMFL